MKRFIIILLFCSQHLLAFQSNSNSTIVTIDETVVTAGELNYAFSKNQPPDQEITLDSLSAYLDIYINFKLKVLEAYERGLDTSTAFQNELSGYLSQLKKPYMEGFDKNEELINEAYDRMQREVNASHILIKIDPNADPADTLKAYQLLDSLRLTINTKEEFEAAAKSISQDGSARDGGNLGWFTVFSMVYPFESATYKTEVGGISTVTRSQFGYHIVYVNDKRAANGKVRTSHIFFSNRLRPDEECELLAKGVYDSLLKGQNWNELARQFSDDNQTKMKGGALPMAGPRQLPEDFLEVAYGLEVEEISEPSQTTYGWHIIRLDQVQPIPEKDQIRSQLEEQIKRSGRSQLGEQAMINKLKLDYNFELEPNASSIIKELEQSSDALPAKELKSKTLFTIGDQPRKVVDLVNYRGSRNISYQQLFSAFERREIIAYADSVAPYDYPEYGFLMKEYEEGLLLFEIMQTEVWNRAVEDSLGQVAYYENNIEKYESPERLEVFEISLANAEQLDSVYGKLQSMETQQLLDYLKSTENGELKIAKKRKEVSELSSFEGFNSLKGSMYWSNTNSIIITADLLEAGYYDFDEIRGRIISDYQTLLDEKFIIELREKRQIEIDQKALKSMIR